MYLTFCRVRTWSPILHLTVPIPLIKGDVLPSPRVTEPDEGLSDQKIPFP